MTQPDRLNEKDHQLCIGILRILEHQRKHSDMQPGGASGLVLMELLAVDVHAIEASLTWLKKKDYIQVGPKKFLITESGQRFLKENYQ